MKRCPTCQKTFTDQHLSFCTDDGTPLAAIDDSVDETSADETTQVRSSARGNESSSAEQPLSSGSASEGSAPPYQPPGSYRPPTYAGKKSRTWPWAVGILTLVVLALAGLGFVAARLIPSMLRSASHRNTSNVNANVDRRGNSNLNEGNSNANSNSSNLNENSNDNSDANNSTPPPTDQAKVLADLKDLEDEWTVANINADKKKLNHILADDYVGTFQGRDQGKAEYLKTVERDTAIQHWEFEELKVSLSGDRAALTGVLRLDVKDQNNQQQELLFRFTDKFVWRDGRWQASGSQVEPLPAKPGTTL